MLPSSSYGQTSLHFGAIAEVDNSLCRARVSLPDLGMVSYWLPVLQYRAGTNTAYWMPTVSEPVAVLLDEKGEQGVILGGVYSRVNQPPASTSNTLAVDTGTVTIDANVNITGTVTILGTGNTINGKEITVVGAPDTQGHTLTSSNQ